MFINFINCNGGGGSSSAITEELKGLIERSATSIDIPSGTTKIGDYAFYGCTGMTSVSIPESVTSIGSYAFNACGGLTSVDIPDSVTSIGNYAFSNCNSLTYAILPSGLTAITSNLFDGCRKLETVNIPQGVKDIGSYAFRNCGKLAEITLPDGLTRIRDHAFENCSGLTGMIVIPSGVTKIENDTFKDCKSITSVKFPSTLTQIADRGFQGCSSLNSITCYATTAPTVKNNSFSGVSATGTLYVPSGSTYTSWTAVLPSGWTVNYISKFTSMASYEDLVSHDYTFYKKNGSSTTAFGISFADSAVGAVWYNPEGGITLDGTNYYAQYDSGQDKVVIMNQTTQQPATAEEVALFEQYLIVSSEKDYNGDVYIKTQIVGNLLAKQIGWATNPVNGQWTDWYYDKNQTTSLKKATDINELIAASGFTIVSGASVNHINSLFENQRNIWVTNDGTGDVYSDTPLGQLHYYFVYDTGATGNVELVNPANDLPLSAEERAAIEDFVQFNAVLKCGVPFVTITYLAALDNWAHFDTNPLVEGNTFINTFVPNN